jgi:hypothetical protein
MTTTEGLAKYLLAIYLLKTDATEFGSSAVAKGGLRKVSASSATQDMFTERLIDK